MLQTLRTVLCAVPKAVKAGQQPLMTHFWFHDGRVQGTNGTLTIDAPFDAPELDGCCVPAHPLIHAVDWHIEPQFRFEDGKLVISEEGRSRARLTVQASRDFPGTLPPPERRKDYRISIKPLQRIRPFIGPEWRARSHDTQFYATALIRNGHAYATNGAVLARTEIRYRGPSLVLPIRVVTAMLRTKVSEWNVRLVFDDDLYLSNGKTWIHLQLPTRKIHKPWPSDLEQFFSEDELPKIDSAELLADVEFVAAGIPDPDKPYLICEGDIIQTLDSGTTSAEARSEIFLGRTVWRFPKRSAWHVDTLRRVLKRATHIDFSSYPGPCRWYREEKNRRTLEGVAIGLKLEKAPR